MTMADNDARIEELLARWQAEPGSRVFVQLAEEYRRAGRLNEALKVLEAGLRRQPNYLSAKIALGRCRLETGEVDVAAGIFQEVLRRDATNLVANKLLVEAYLEASNLPKAREQLNLYGILNDRDPDIPEMRRWIEMGGKPKPSPAPAPDPEPESPPEAAIEVAPEPEPDASPFLESVTPELEIGDETDVGLPLAKQTGEPAAAPPAPAPDEAVFDLTSELPAADSEPTLEVEAVEEVQSAVLEDLWEGAAPEAPPSTEGEDPGFTADEGVPGLEVERAAPVAESPAAAIVADGEDLFDLEPPPAEPAAMAAVEAPPALEDPFALDDTADERPPTGRPAPAAPAAPAEGDVFGDLFQADDEQRYLQGLGAEGLFVSAEAPAEAAAPTPEPVPEASPEVDFIPSAEGPTVADAPGEAAAAPAAAEPAVEPAPAPAPAPEPVPEPEPEPEPVAEPSEVAPAAPLADDLFGLDTTPVAPAPEGDVFGDFGSAAPLPGVAAQDADPVFNLPSVAADTTSVRAPEVSGHPMAEAAEPEPAPEPAPREVEDVAATMVMPQLSREILADAAQRARRPVAPEEDEEPPATATLGQLYLQQGHRQEARKIFQRVLERDPAHPVALAALRAMEQEDRGPVEAAAPPAAAAEVAEPSAAGAALPEEPVETAAALPVTGEDGRLTAAALLQGEDLAAIKGLTARKALVLKKYLHRLRPGA
jgi:tetratricopeptide (TPR) repeat protein